jgi:undecaprenyl-diphosphatase
MDTSMLHALNGFAFHHDGFEELLAVYVAASQVLFMALLAVLAAIGGAKRRAAVAAGIGAGLALACAQVISRAVDRPRPFVSDPGSVHLFARHVADAGFPSDHATAAFAIATAIFLRDRRLGAAVLVLAGVLAAGRVALGVHYPTDVVAGAGLGAAVALVLHVPAARTRIDRLADAVGRVIATWAGALGLRQAPWRDGLRRALWPRA